MYFIQILSYYNILMLIRNMPIYISYEPLVSITNHAHAQIFNYSGIGGGIMIKIQLSITKAKYN